MFCCSLLFSFSISHISLLRLFWNAIRNAFVRFYNSWSKRQGNGLKQRTKLTQVWGIKSRKKEIQTKKKRIDKNFNQFFHRLLWPNALSIPELGYFSLFQSIWQCTRFVCGLLFCPFSSLFVNLEHFLFDARFIAFFVRFEIAVKIISQMFSGRIFQL